jgi:hypothetical protein
MTDPILTDETYAITTFIKTYWPIGVAVIGFVVSVLVVLKGKIPFMEKQLDVVFEKIKKLENNNFIPHNVLFDKDEQFKFQTVPMCIDMREECHMQQKMFQDNFCRKLDDITIELKGIVKDADSKRDETRTEITSMNKQLIELMTQMKTILARDRRQETAEMVRLVVQQVVKQMRVENSIK